MNTLLVIILIIQVFIFAVVWEHEIKIDKITRRLALCFYYIKEIINKKR
jgi:amino acid permease